MIYSNNDARLLLGCLFQQPTLLMTGKYPVKVEDFEPVLFHKYMFKCVLKLLKKGANIIDIISVGELISSYPEVKEVLEDNEYDDFIETTTSLANLENIEVYFNNVRKFTILREFEKDGISIDEIYDSSKACTNKLDEMNIEGILNYFEAKVVDKKKRFSINNDSEEMWAGEDFDIVLEEFEEEPALGANFSCPYQTAISRGWQKGHLVMRSSSSGGGKTTSVIGDLCNISVTKKWDFKKGCYMKNENKVTNASFYIHTEMTSEKEIQPKFISWISGIEYNKILDGNYDKETKERLLEAGRILKESKIKLIYMPHFTVPLLRTTIKNLCLNEGCDYGVFDYIEDNQIVGAVMKQETGLPIRQDMILFNITSALQNISEENNCGMYTMTQLNGNEKTNEIIDENCLFGGKSQKNKIVYGEIILELRKKELEIVDLFIQKKGFEIKKKPNRIKHVYKARFGKYGNHIKIWQYLDGGTGRCESLFCTDAYNNPINVDKLVIETINK